MSVLSKIRDFLSRHKTKFLIGGILISGTILFTKYTQKRLKEWHEKEALEIIERNRKKVLFESINKTCDQTTINLTQHLLDRIYVIINTEDSIEKLKLNPKDKLEIWITLKNQVFTKALTIIYSYVILVITLRVQLNILGAYMYKNTENMQVDIQEKYLSLSQEFIINGVDKLSYIIQAEVEKVLRPIDFKKELNITNMEAIFWSLQDKLNASKDNPINHFKEYIFRQDPPISNDVYNSMLRDTADLLESEEIRLLAHSNIMSCFLVLSNLLLDFLDEPSTQNSTHNNGQFNQPHLHKKPMAKILPILNGLLSKQSLPKNLIYTLTTGNTKLQIFGANIYESLLE